MEFQLNGRPFVFDGDDGTPLLWVIRDAAGLTGTKYGCGIGACGACTVHLEGVATRTCVLPVSAAAGRRITTIEARIRFSRRGSPRMCRSAATASPAW